MPIRLGIIGLSSDPGSWASAVHLAAIKSHPDLYTVVALATSSPASAAAAGKVHGIPPEKCYGSASDLANDPDVDMVVVSVKTALHKQLALPVIEAGKSLFVEWPLANGLSEAQAVADAAKAKGIKNVVGLQGRHTATLVKAKQIIESGAIGRVVSTEFVGTTSFLLNLSERNEYLTDIKQGANIVTIFSGHILDSILSILGEFESLQATTAQIHSHIDIVGSGGKVLRRTASNVPDFVSVQGTLKGGAGITFQLSGAAKVDGMVWHIHGDKGSLKFESPNPSVQIVPPTLYEYKGGSWVKVEVDVSGVSPALPVARIYQAFATENKEGLVSFGQAIVRHRMLEAIWKSARDGTRESYDTKV